MHLTFIILPCNLTNFKEYEAISCFNECSTRREKNVKFVKLLVYASAIEKKITVKLQPMFEHAKNNNFHMFQEELMAVKCTWFRTSHRLSLAVVSITVKYFQSVIIHWTLSLTGGSLLMNFRFHLKPWQSILKKES